MSAPVSFLLLWLAHGPCLRTYLDQNRTPFSFHSLSTMPLQYPAYPALLFIAQSEIRRITLQINVESLMVKSVMKLLGWDASVCIVAESVK
mmetsp:Transcript_51764/g.108160  ORF Transcript_51764/g.108160 Transcript_51764/m.108160 type:complete len:91 (+) Transcript_51764:1464-1736(+)